MRVRQLLVLALVVAPCAAVSLAACGGSSSSHSSPGSPTGTASTTPSGVTPATPGTPSGTAPSASAALSAQQQVDRIALGTGDLGPGWTGSTIEDGATLASPTLDLCERTAPSDKLRTARRQTLMVSRTTALSTEIVSYRDGGAAQALREAAATARSCQNVPDTDDGTSFVESVAPVAGHAAWGANAVAVSETITHNGETVTSYAVYQAQGNTLAAVYDFGLTASKALVFQIADLTNSRLRAVLAGATPPTETVPVPAGPPLDLGDGSSSAPDGGIVT